MAAIFSRGDKLEQGHYTVLKEIGLGGMGVVYHCRDEFLTRDVALKMLLPELMADKSNLEVFKQEARFAAQLEHPNIVTVYDIGAEDRNGKQHHFVAMEYLPGGTLAARVMGSPLPVEHALNWMKQLAQALAFAHKRGVIHQDIKADNIFITTEGDLKIGDFGLARLLLGKVYVGSSSKGMGTPAYMSPELCRGEPQDHRSDIYSLGVLFFEMATGQLPYRAAGMIEMAMKHSSAPIPSAKRINAKVPDFLDKVIRRMMAKTPDERYQSVADIQTILDDLIFEMRVARLGLGVKKEPVAEPSPPSAPPQPQPQPPAAAAPSQGATSAGKGVQTPPLSTNTTEYFAPPRSYGSGTKAEPHTSVQKPPLSEQTVYPQGQKAFQPKAQTAPPDTAIKPEVKTNGDGATKSGQTAQKSPATEPAVTAPAAKTSQKTSTTSAKAVQSISSTSLPRAQEPVPNLWRSGQRLLTLAPEGLTKLWKFKTDGPIGWGSQLCVDREEKTVFVASADGVLYSLDIATGQLNWKTTIGSSLVSGPSIAADHLIVTTLEGNVTSLNKDTGEQRWNRKTTFRMASAPVVHMDRVFFTSIEGRLTAMDLRTGDMRWHYQTEDTIAASPTCQGNLLLVGTRGGCLRSIAIDSGACKWKLTLDGAILGQCATSVDSVYVGTQSGSFSAVEIETGRLNWEYKTEKAIVARPLILYTSVLFASHDRWLYACEKYVGALNWKSALRGKVFSNLAMHDDNVITVSRDGWVHSHKPRNGGAELMWLKEIGGQIDATPVWTSDRFIVGNVAGELTAYTLPSGQASEHTA